MGEPAVEVQNTIDGDWLEAAAGRSLLSIVFISE